MTHWNADRPAAGGDLSRAGHLLRWGPMRCFRFTALVLAAVQGLAAEKMFDLSGDPLNQPPAGWRSMLAGTGQPGDWQVILDEAPTEFATLNPGTPRTPAARQRVIAQLSKDPTDERFPLLVYDPETFGDFTLTLRFKTVAGAIEQMAGVAFRLQDERNFYVVRASSLGNTFRFYRVVNGVRDNPLGPEIEITRGTWHTLAIAAKGNRFRLDLDGKEAMPELTDNTFADGRIALWTKSDSVSHFTDLHLDYQPREPLARALVREALQRYPRLVDLRIYAPSTLRPELHVVAAKLDKALGEAAGKYEKDVLEKDTILVGNDKDNSVVVLPLRDRNGDPVAAVRVVMERFPGQTPENAVARAKPVLRTMEGRFRAVKELTE